MSHQYTMEIRAVIDWLNRIPMPRRTAERTIILIKRLDGEIERLYKNLGKVQCEQYTNGRNDGIKEFAERLKAQIVSKCCVVDDDVDCILKCIGNLVKEMTEDKDG